MFLHKSSIQQLFHHYSCKPCTQRLTRHSTFPFKMFKLLVFLAIALGVAAGAAVDGSYQPSISRKDAAALKSSTMGVVDPVHRCGGVGTPMQLRISDCTGRCTFIPGRVYNCEKDFMPSSASPSLTLRVEICMNTGLCMQIINTELPNSSVQPGFIYTARYSVVPNDVLSGQTVEFRAYILHTDNLLMEICMSAMVEIAAPGLL